MENSTFKERLTEHLLQVCTSQGYLNGVLLSSPDIDEAWVRYAPSYYGDAVREFNGYPEFTLACAGYLGMAVATLWDRDWPRFRETPYAFFQGERGFDDMDDHIAENILKEHRHSGAAMQSCSAAAYHLTRSRLLTRRSHIKVETAAPASSVSSGCEPTHEIKPTTPFIRKPVLNAAALLGMDWRRVPMICVSRAAYARGIIIVRGDSRKMKFSCRRR